MLSVLVLAVLPGRVGAAGGVREHSIEPEDYFSIGVITDCTLSADGALVAYTENRWEPPAEERNLDLWVVDRRTGTRRRLTFERGSDASPVWSPDGQYIYYTAKAERPGETKPPYNGKTQVWRVSPAGGPPQPVTQVPDGIGLFDLSADGRRLYYTRTEEHYGDEWEKLRKEYKDLKYGHGVGDVSQVWKLDLESWRADKVVDDKRVITDFAVTPDERRIAMVTTPDDTLLAKEGWSRVDVFDLAGGKITPVTADGWRDDHPSPYGWLERVSWSGDGEALTFTVGYDGYPCQIYVAEWAGEKVALRKLTRPEGVEVSDAGRLIWRGRSRELCFVGESLACRRVYGIPDIRDGKQGHARVLTSGDVVVDALSLDRAGETLAVVMGSTEHPPEIYHAPAGDKASPPTRLTTVNPQVDTWKLPQIQRVSWKGADGDEVEGILELPPAYEAGKPLPMIVEIHGGPTAATPYCLQVAIYGRTLMPAKGYAVLSPNYHGSTGYGDEFMTKLVGRENDIEVEDILKGVDAMIERGIADPNRIGVMGWSNGGFLTNCVITRGDRFKAASSGAGVLDMVIQWGAEDTPGHVVNFMHGLPWEAADAYRKASPMYGLGKVRAPTLIHVGGNDERCPPANSRALYRALRHYVKVPVELVVYPGEGHGLTKYTNRKAKMAWDVAWFDRYLLGKSPETRKADEKQP